MVGELEVLLLQQPLASIFTPEIRKALSEMLMFDVFNYQAAANPTSMCSSAFAGNLYTARLTRLCGWQTAAIALLLCRAQYVHGSTKHWSDPSTVFTTMYFCSFTQSVAVMV